MIVSAMAAMAENRVIGVNNGLPWNLPEDLKRFKKFTSGHPIIMGRKTYESMGKPLPNRDNLIVTRQDTYSVQGAHVFSTIEAAVRWCEGKTDEVFVIGGAEIWKAGWLLLDRIYLTVIHRKFEGDTFFPPFDWNDWQVTFKEDHSEPMPYTYYTLERKQT